jgi:CRISPR-associated endonuclease/helicase Cas3
MKNKEFYSRKNDDGSRYQTTYEHIKNVAELAGIYGSKFGFSETARLAAMYHDMGKLSDSFLNYLLNDIGRRGEIIHSRQGAKYILDHMPDLDKRSAVLAALIVAGHHGELFDCVSVDGLTPFVTKLKNTDKPIYYDEVVSNYTEIFKSTNVSGSRCNDEMEFFLNKCRELKMYTPFALHMIVKLIYSAVVDADRYDAYLFEVDKPLPIAEETKIPDWSTLLRNLEISLSSMNSDAENSGSINELRKNISDKCLEEADREQGLFRLLLPTGGGKTLSGLRFALKQAENHKLKHIIYVIPYLSILEQTANELRDKLGLGADNDVILEHHSNAFPIKDDDKPNNKNEDENEKEWHLLTSRWDSPIIVTTMVQFLESIFSHKSRNLRKLHNMTESVFIFDEIQNLPVKCVYMFNEAINFLTEFARDTVVLCSATQPILDKISPHVLKLSDNSSLVDEKMIESFNLLKRTKIEFCDDKEYDCDNLADFAIEKFTAEKSVLVIVNTRSCAEKIFRKIEQSGVNAYHLSTNMCGEHRIDILDTVKKDLQNKVPVICVSTQLIEAGVDISFGCVIRSISGLDSIAQAAGRCNRHGEYGETKNVYVVELKDEDLSKLEDIKEGVKVSERIFRELKNGDIDGDALSENVMNEFYKRYFYKRKSEFCYPLKNKGNVNIFDMLSCNNIGKGALKNKFGEKEFGRIMGEVVLPYAFETAGKNFSVIARDTKEVIVEFYNDDSRQLVVKYNNADIGEKKKLLRRLGKYSISLWDYQYKDLCKKGAINEFDNELCTLADGFYNKETGLDLNGTHTVLMT